ncbi:hypothetical protein M2432_005480 [Mycobacterium sp. OTB74]|jgi:hypothetical protein|nr:hypothetical protein [Mycobacterium sp. OTB74]
MQVVGWVAVAVVAAVVVAGGLISVRSIPDMRRYMRMRRM